MSFNVTLLSFTVLWEGGGDYYQLSSVPCTGMFKMMGQEDSNEIQLQYSSFLKSCAWHAVHVVYMEEIKLNTNL